MAPRLTTSSYAVLGLLTMRPWSAYELAQQAERSLRFAWPRSERQLYSEPKKLVELGLAVERQESAGPQRQRTIYEATPAGRSAVASWLSEPPTPPTVEVESMLRVLFADAGSIEDLLESISKLRADTEDFHDWSRHLVSGYRSGADVPFPERLHLGVLLATFHVELFRTIEAWADFARREVERWESTSEPGRAARTHEFIDAICDDRSVLDL